MRSMAARSVEEAVQASGHRRSGKRRNAAQWAQVIATQRQSELTVVEFCRRRGIAKATFWYWRRRLATTEKQELVAKPVQRFLAVPLVAPVTERIEVDLGAIRVRLDGAGAARLVDAIVARVETGTRE